MKRLYYNMGKEQWKPVKGFEERYEVSDHGRVRSNDMRILFRRGYGIRKGKALKEQTDRGGYKTVELSDGLRRKGGKRNNPGVHVLVAQAFIDGHFEGATVDHLDFDPANNHVSNLEWVTQKENNRRSRDAGRANAAKGSQQPRAKLTEADIPVIRQMRKDGMILREIAEKYSISIAKISEIVNHKAWKHV